MAPAAQSASIANMQFALAVNLPKLPVVGRDFYDFSNLGGQVDGSQPGRDAFVGSSLRVESAFITVNEPMHSGVIAASAPPAKMISA